MFVSVLLSFSCDLCCSCVFVLLVAFLCVYSRVFCLFGCFIVADIFSIVVLDVFRCLAVCVLFSNDCVFLQSLLSCAS